jgi:hypothetical protein
MQAADSDELPIHKLLRARKILIHGGGAEEIRWAFEYIVDAVGVADPFDGRFPGKAGEALLKSNLTKIPEPCLQKLALYLGDGTWGIALYMIADLLMLLPEERTSRYLTEAKRRVNPQHGHYNMASIAYVRAMHGDRQSREWLVALNRKERVPDYRYHYLMSVLQRYPDSDREAERFWTEDYKLYLPPDLLKEALSRPRIRLLDYLHLPKDEQIYRRCREEFTVRHERTGILYMRPSGRFFTDFGQYPGWERLADEQSRAFADLNAALSDEEKVQLKAPLERFYRLEGDDLGLERLLLGWLTDRAPFRLFWI